jgi:hypothetical protein
MESARARIENLRDFYRKYYSRLRSTRTLGIPVVGRGIDTMIGDERAAARAAGVVPAQADAVAFERENWPRFKLPERQTRPGRNAGKSAGGVNF